MEGFNEVFCRGHKPKFPRRDLCNTHPVRKEVLSRRGGVFSGLSSPGFRHSPGEIAQPPVRRLHTPGRIRNILQAVYDP